MKEPGVSRGRLFRTMFRGCPAAYLLLRAYLDKIPKVLSEVNSARGSLGFPRHGETLDLRGLGSGCLSHWSSCNGRAR